MNKAKLGHFIMRVFRGGEDYLDPPNHSQTFKWNPYFDEPKHYECCVLNSESPSDQVWLGSNHKWYRFYGGAEFRKIAAWVLWRWVWGDWFGLKTKLWCYGLTLAVYDAKKAWKKAING